MEDNEKRKYFGTTMYRIVGFIALVTIVGGCVYKMIPSLAKKENFEAGFQNIRSNLDKFKEPAKQPLLINKFFSGEQLEQFIEMWIHGTKDVLDGVARIRDFSKIFGRIMIGKDSENGGGQEKNPTKTEEADTEYPNARNLLINTLSALDNLKKEDRKFFKDLSEFFLELVLITPDPQKAIDEKMVHGSRETSKDI